MEQKNSYQIVVNRRQLELIARCLEDISRFAAGQPELHHTVESLLANHDDSCEKRDEIEAHLLAIKKILYPELSDHASYGYDGGDQRDPIRKNLIGNTYQIYREILHFLAVKDRQNNAYNSVTLPSGNLGPIKVKEIPLCTTVQDCELAVQETEKKAIKAFDMYLRNYLQLEVTEERYSTLMNDFKDTMRALCLIGKSES